MYLNIIMILQYLKTKYKMYKARREQKELIVKLNKIFEEYKKREEKDLEKVNKK